MNRFFYRKRGFYTLFILSLVIFVAGSARADFLGDNPTGLIELKDYKYPVYLFVPSNYKADREYTLIMTVPGEGESPEENISFWTGIAKRRSALVLTPTNLWPEELPYTVDEWLMGIKDDVLERFRISRKRVFLIGKEGGAHYASYLGTNYSEQFAGVALLGGSWHGKYSKLLKVQGQPRKQIPFFVSFKSDQDEQLIASEAIADRFQQKGYPIHLEKLEAGQAFSERNFKRRMLDWLEENADNWQRLVQENNKSWKQKILIWLEEFFRV